MNPDRQETEDKCWVAAEKESDLQRGTASCRDGEARSHPHRPQRRRASGAKEERDQPYCTCGLCVKEKDTLCEESELLTGVTGRGGQVA